MANQFTNVKYDKIEITEILNLYNKGYSKSVIATLMHRRKDNIKKILIDNGVWDENRSDWKRIFTDKEKEEIKRMYLTDKLNTIKIGLHFGTSCNPIKKVLKDFNVLRIGNSNGIIGVYQLDHKFSILEGFKQNINPEIIGCIANLEFIPWEENAKKRNKCSINLSKIS